MQFQHIIDIRSDTVTQPTPAMKKAMVQAALGDDVYREDPTLILLEEKAAQLFGKQAGIFMMSGVMSNLVGVMSWIKQGEQVLVHRDSHIFCNQSGSLSLAGGSVRSIAGKDCKLTPSLIKQNTKAGSFITQTKTVLVCVQNALSNGHLYTKEQMNLLTAQAHQLDLKVHMDGARIFAAAYAQNISLEEAAAGVDSLCFCLSKGLCCPIGSVLLGPKDFIQRARKFRKMIGGGIRQGGYLAAAGIYALQNMTQSIRQDLRLARGLQARLHQINKVSVQRGEINLVFFKSEGTNASELVKFLWDKHRIKMNEPFQPTFMFRIAIHHYIREEQIDKIVSAIRQFMNI